MTAFSRRTFATLTLGAGALLAGCASNAGNTGGADDTEPGTAGAQADRATDTGYPVTLTGALGTATISERPRRVVALGVNDGDALLALDVVPVRQHRLCLLRHRIRTLGG